MRQPPVFSRNAARQATIRAIHLDEALRIDGVLDEDVYQQVPPIDDFIQSLPHEGAAASERTEAWVMFDGKAIYIAARCWDSAPPSEWIANEMRRDSPRIGDQDGISILLDTFHDRRNGFTFATTSLGARFDAQLNNESSVNMDWNAVWDVRAGTFDGGWTIEIAVPFKSLRYRAGSAQEWGIQLRRQIRRKNEWVFLTPVPAQIMRSAMMRASLGATLTGLDLPAAGSNVEIKPYAISRLTTDRLQTPAVRNDATADFGIDAKYGITAGLTADFSYNTDFAQVEVDEQQVNLTRFNLLFPEKREFFLEGRGIFEFARPASGGAAAADLPTLFYSRRIGLDAGRVIPIEGGGRVTGKVGKYAVGLLSMQTADDPVSDRSSTNFTVARVSRDILQRSNVGVIATQRSHSVATPGSNQAYGVDGAFSFFQNLSMNAYWAQTATEGRKGDDVSYMGRMEYAPDRYGVRAEYLAVGSNFNPEVGFLRRTGIRRSFASGRFSPRPRGSRVVRKVTSEGSAERILNRAGQVEYSQETGHVDVEFDSSDRVSVDANHKFERFVRPFTVASGVAIPAGGYGFSDSLLSYAFGPQRRVSGTVAWQQGQFYDGTISAVSYTGGRVSVTKHFSFDPSLSVNRVRLPAGNFTTRLVRVRNDYAFSPWMFASALLQFNSADRSFNSNLRFRWEYRPGSEFFVVYTDERDTTAGGLIGLKNRALVLKINRLLRF